MRPILFFLVVNLLTFGNLAVAGSPDRAAAQTDNITKNQDFLASSVDGIMIPNKVLSEVQLKHQGFAVVHAEEIYRSGQKHYKLKVGRDLYDDKDSFYLIYTKDWNLVEKEEILKPEPVQYQPEVELEEEIKEIEEEYEEIEEEIQEEIERAEEEARSMQAEPEEQEKPKPVEAEPESEDEDTEADSETESSDSEEDSTAEQTE